MAFWDKIGSSGNVEDRRGMGGGGLAISGITGLVLFLAFMFLGGQDTTVLDQLLGQVSQQQATQSGEQPPEFQGADDYEVFASKVLGSNNDTWGVYLILRGLPIKRPNLFCSVR